MDIPLHNVPDKRPSASLAQRAGGRMVGLVILELTSPKLPVLCASTASAEVTVPKRVSLNAKHCTVPRIASGSCARDFRGRNGLDSRSTRSGPDAHQPSCSARFIGCLMVHLIVSVLKKLFPEKQTQGGPVGNVWFAAACCKVRT